MHHLPIIALKCNQDKVKKYINNELEYQRLNEIFSDTNAMEVSIATINVIIGVQIIKKKMDSYRSQAGMFLFNALEYILSNIELGIKYSNNHYFFNLIGLLWILESVENDRKLSRIKSFAYKQLEIYLSKSINKDGSFFEGSTHYHKYVTESLLSFLVYINGSNKTIMYYAVLLYKFCCYATLDNELIGFGDNDSGRILPLPKYFEYESSRLDVINHLAQKLGFEKYSLGDEELLQSLNTSSNPSFGILKVSNDTWKVAFRCDQINNKSVNKIIGGHCHNDQLSIIVNYLDSKLFVDSGTYSYIQENNARLNNLKTESHNTLTIEGLEQNTISNDWIYVERKAHVDILKYNETEIIGEYHGNKDIVHRRSIKIGDKFQVTDYLEFKDLKTTKIRIYYYLDSIANVKEYNSHSVLISLKNDIRLKMSLSENGILSIRDSIVSSEYGKREKNNVAIIELNISENKGYVENKVIIERV
jgi:hypothetical protein